MLSAEQCRKRAQECAEMAQSLTGERRRIFLGLAQSWLELADEDLVMPPSPPKPTESSQRR
jgi:hypothetical protein